MTVRDILFVVTAIFGIVLVGCSGSTEASKTPPTPAQTSATEMMQKETISLRAQNDSLRGLTARMEQDRRALAARVADLEMQLNDLKTKQAAPAPLEQPKEVEKPAREIQPVTNARDSYNRALEAFRARQYDDAANILQGVVDAGAPDGMEDNCYYWLGECSFAQKKYNDAIEHFTHVFTYDRSEKKDDAQVMIANAYYAMGDKKKAKEAYEKLVRTFPASPFVKKAKARLTTL